MYAASEDFARAHGGPLAHRFLDAIPSDYRQAAAEAGLTLNIDFRVHDLEVGDYPASPGWHCDSPFREIAFDALAPTTAVQRNLVGTISTAGDGVSNTLFLDTPINVDSIEAPGSFALWRMVDRHLGAREDLHTTSTRDGEFTEFDCWTLHCAAPALHAGVRMFCRVSMWQPPALHCPGISRIEQVYRRVAAPGRS